MGPYRRELRGRGHDRARRGAARRGTAARAIGPARLGAPAAPVHRPEGRRGIRRAGDYEAKMVFRADSASAIDTWAFFPAKTRANMSTTTKRASASVAARDGGAGQPIQRPTLAAARKARSLGSRDQTG